MQRKCDNRRRRKTRVGFGGFERIKKSKLTGEAGVCFGMREGMTRILEASSYVLVAAYLISFAACQRLRQLAPIVLHISRFGGGGFLKWNLIWRKERAGTGLTVG